MTRIPFSAIGCAVYRAAQDGDDRDLDPEELREYVQHSGLSAYGWAAKILLALADALERQEGDA